MRPFTGSIHRLERSFDHERNGSYLRQVGVLFVVEGLAQHPLLNSAQVFADHLLGGVNVHGHVHELPVKEGHTSLQAPCRGGFVSSLAIVQVQRLDLLHVHEQAGYALDCLRKLKHKAMKLVI